MKSRLLILGSRGFIGSWLARELAGEFTLCDDSGVDVASAASVGNCFKRNAPEMVVLAAAIADIDRCQREPALAEAVNATGAGHVARECAAAGSRLMFLSTGAVFDGTRSGYAEDDPVSPLSVYGRTKARAESIVESQAPDAVILRLALVLGRGPRAGTNSLVDRMQASFSKGEAVSVPADEIRNPIDAGSLCRFARELLVRREATGTFHVGSRDAVSRYELAREIAAQMGFSPELVRPQNGPAGGRAPRGRDQFLIPARLEGLCRIAAPGWREAAERCVHATAESAA